MTTFSVNSFASLCSRFSTWDALRPWLESKEGGSLRVIDGGSSRYAIVRYVKEKSDMTQEHVRMFRSVVWNKETNRPVCVAPVKAERGEPPVGASVEISEFVDGVMMNLWCSAVDGQIEVATRTSLGAGNTFYTGSTFADMLKDSCEGRSLQEEFGTRIPRGGFLNIVLQHPNHKTVGLIKNPRYSVISCGVVSEDGGVVFDTSCSTAHQFDAGKSVSDLMRQGARRGHMWQGLVFQDRTSSRRWRMRNPAFVNVRTLRGSESDGFARFLRLRATGKTKEYLGYFREESNEMWGYEQRLRKTTADLLDSYTAMNKLKTKKMTDIDYPLRPHVYALHGKYLASLPNPIAVSKDVVIQYVNGLSVEEQLKLCGGSKKI